MEIFDKIKSGLIGFSKMLSSVDVPDVDNPEVELSNELKEQLALADGLAYRTADMIKHKKEKSFAVGLTNKGVVKERKEVQKINEVDKDDKERDDRI